MVSKDLLLRRLLLKKKELVLLFSDRSRRLLLAGNEQEQQRLLDERDCLIRDLQQTDDSIRLREQEMSLSCLVVEKELCEEIVVILRTIINNDQNSLSSLEEEKRKINLKKKRLNLESNLRGYLK